MALVVRTPLAHQPIPAHPELKPPQAISLMEEVGVPPPPPEHADTDRRLLQLCASQRDGAEAVRSHLENALGIIHRSLAALHTASCSCGREMDDTLWIREASAPTDFPELKSPGANRCIASNPEEFKFQSFDNPAEQHSRHDGLSLSNSNGGEGAPGRPKGSKRRSKWSASTAASAISASDPPIVDTLRQRLDEGNIEPDCADAAAIHHKWASMAEKLCLVQSGCKGIAAAKCLRPVWAGSAVPRASPRNRKYFCLGAVGNDTTEELTEQPQSHGIEKALQCLVVSPSSLWRLAWELSGFLVLMFDMITLPLEVFDFGETDFSKVFRYIVSTFWLCDMTLSFFSGYMHHGVPEVRLWKVWKHYLRGWFGLDLIIVSVDWVLLFVDQATSTLALPRTFKVGRFVRVVRLLRFARFWHMLPNQAQSQRSVTGTLVTQALKTFLGSFLLLLLPVFFSHIVACCWYWLGKRDSSDQNPSWMDVIDKDTLNSKVALYWLCFHWALSQYTPAPNGIHPATLSERVFVVVTLLIGFIVFSCFLGTVTSMVTAARLSTQKRLEEESQIVQFLRGHRVSFDLSHQVVSLTKQQRVRKTLLVEEDIAGLKALPEIIRVRLHHEVFCRHLQRHSFFDWICRRDQSMMAQLAHYAVKSVSYSRLSEIFLFGQPTKKMRFVMDGVLNYMAGYKNRRAFTSVHAGESFCEPALWMDWLLQGYATALTDCRICTVNSDALCEVVSSDYSLFSACKTYALSYIEKLGDMFGVDVYFHIHHQESGFKIPKIDDMGLPSRDIDGIVDTLPTDLIEAAESIVTTQAVTTVEPKKAFSASLAPGFR